MRMSCKMLWRTTCIPQPFVMMSCKVKCPGIFNHTNALCFDVCTYVPHPVCILLGRGYTSLFGVWCNGKASFSDRTGSYHWSPLGCGYKSLFGVSFNRKASFSDTTGSHHWSL